MIFDTYSEFLKIAFYMASIAVAVTLIYIVLTEGGYPLIATQTNGYEAMVNNSTQGVIDIVNGAGVF